MPYAKTGLRAFARRLGMIPRGARPSIRGRGRARLVPRSRPKRQRTQDDQIPGQMRLVDDE